MLTDKQRKTFEYFSRYQYSDVYYDTTDQKYWMANSFWLYDDTPYIIYTAKQGDTYDNLALRYYANPTYWWIITDFNRVIDPFVSPKIGEKIKIPIFSNLEFDT